MGWLCGAGRDGSRDCQIFPHFLNFFWPDAANGEQIVDVFEGAVGFAHLQDFVGGHRADAGHLLQLCGAGGIDVDRAGGRLFLGQRMRRQKQHHGYQ